MSKVRRVLGRCAQAVRKRWNADTVAAAAMGWTVETGRFGRTVVRDPRFDHRRTTDERPVVASVPGRWS
jgi:hypothetical protein